MALLESTLLSIREFKAPDFSLPATDGKNYSLSSFAGNQGLVVVFTCNHCPYAQAAWPLLIKLAEEYNRKGIAFVAINPNDSSLYPDDSFESMKRKVVEWGINFPYLRDKSQKVAHAFQAQCTPDIYVFDKENKLYYHGRVNDNWQDESKATREDLKDALESLLSDNSPPKEQFPSMGCSIKWTDK